ncbi:alpha/beta hydrolase family protein [Chloroflexota bacterium]
MIDLQLLSIGPFRLPSWFAIFVALAGRFFFNADFSKIRPAQVVEQVEQPIFFIHGEDDPVVSAEETEELHDISDNQEDLSKTKHCFRWSSTSGANYRLQPLNQSANEL